MKKWIYLIAMLAALFILLAYLFVPPTANIINVTGIKASQNAVVRALAMQDKWDSFTKNHCKVTEPLRNGANVAIAYNGKLFQSQVIVIPISLDSVTTRWECIVPGAHNPFTRISAYLEARELKSNMEATMSGAFKPFCENPVNVYGMSIYTRSTTDTMLLATRFPSADYPSMESLYREIDKIKTYAAKHDLKQISPPIFNATLTDSNTYRCMVALPINKKTSARGDIFYVRMVPGKFLSADLKGGVRRVRSAHNMMQHYILDYKKTIMAIPFEQLITDRQAEKDSTKWETRLFYPTP